MTIIKFLEKYSVKINIILALLVVVYELINVPLTFKIFKIIFISIYSIIELISTCYLIKNSDSPQTHLRTIQLSCIILIQIFLRSVYGVQIILICAIWFSQSLKKQVNIVLLFLFFTLALIGLAFGVLQERELGRVYSEDGKYYASVVEIEYGLSSNDYTKIIIGKTGPRLFVSEKIIYAGYLRNFNRVTWKNNKRIQVDFPGGPIALNIFDVPLDDRYSEIYVYKYFGLVLSEIMLLTLVNIMISLRNKVCFVELLKDHVELRCDFYKL